MGRAERRRAERNKRIEERKGKILMSPQDINQMKRNIAEDVTDFKVETMMTVFALANCRLYGHKARRTMRTLAYIDELMGPIATGEKTVDDYRKELEDETGVRIQCK